MRIRQLPIRVGLIVALALSPALIAAAPAQSAAADELDWNAIGDEAVELLRQYLAIDTTNPPGNEIAGAEFFAGLLAAEGVDAEVFESLPGRGNIVARLEGDGSRGGHIVLLNHMDVVPVSAEFWRVDPYGAEIVDGKMYGRGITDMKAAGVVQLIAMLALRRAGVALGRDVVFMGTAAEETGGVEGAGYIVEHRPDLLDGVQYVLTEGGGGQLRGDVEVHAIEFTQKTPLWLRLVARGPAGHGSRAIEDSAANRLIRALDRVRTYQPPIELVPAVAEMIRASAQFVPDPDMAAALRDIEANFSHPDVLDPLSARMGTMLRSTVAITTLEGSTKTNVISPLATAELDCRLLPGTDADLFIATLRDVIDDPDIEIETILRFETSESRRDTALWRAIEQSAQRRSPGAIVVPSVLAGFTDSHYFRERGIVAYGWSPIVSAADDGPAHGVDERLSVEAVRNAPRLLYDVLELLAAQRPGP
jgi:acetylornithine deacetylase/succinyl-diaminopimelate desuccinylase-like protein